MKHTWNASAHAGLMCSLAAIGLAMSSCATKQCVDYRSYAKPPEKPAAAAVRNVLMDIPSTRETMFYGNYGGLGSNGGRPVDEMDELFRRHDIVYTEAKTQKMMRLADEVLVEYLKKIKDCELSEKGIEYRDRSIEFMESSLSGIVGKPFSSLFWCEEPESSCFQDSRSVIDFFSPCHSGFPECRTCQ